MNQSPIRYTDIHAEGGRFPGLHLRVMQALTRLIAPWARVRGLGIVAALLSSLLKGEETRTHVKLNKTSRFAYPSYDSYWGYFVHSNKIYEQSLALFLAQIAACRFCFIDCGANYGYWSAIMSSEEFGAHPCLAIEASPQAFAILQKNAALNDNRFRCLQRAVYRNSDEQIAFTAGGQHAGRHIIDGHIETFRVNTKGLLTPTEYECQVKTISLERVIQDFFPQEHAFVVKLDVEGAEIDALRGGGGDDREGRAISLRGLWRGPAINSNKLFPEGRLPDLLPGRSRRHTAPYGG